ncbi:MAG: DNA polymerase III subunit gamma/tau [Clostridiales bacterium]
MEHLALYRKWRPQTFDEVIGQTENTKILKAAVAKSHAAHAYLFCGTRGTGKTSTARILAKALNCHNPQNGEPCNQCDSCLSITSGRCLDVLEIDAASNRGIDEVRDLLEKVHFVPAEGRYKVYIIDEAHMLTTEAFNALLKTFEEPPAHVVFILATTEARKVPLTILSRCQRYDFRPIGEIEMISALKAIAQKENLNITEDAVAFLAQKAKGSMRDALSLMDQGMGAGDKTMTVEDLGSILGSVMVDFWQGFIQNIATGNVAAVFSAIDDLEAEGKDLRVFFQDFQEILGDLLSYRGDATQSYGKAVKSCSGILTNHQIIDMLTVIGEGETAFRYHRDNKIVCRFLLAKIMQMLRQGAIPTATVATTATVAAATDSAAAKPKNSAPKKANPIPQDTAKADINQPPAENKNADSYENTPPWEDVPLPNEPEIEPLDDDLPWEVAKPKSDVEKNIKADKATPKATRFVPEVDENEEIWSQILAETKKISSKTYTWLSRGELKKIIGDLLIVGYNDNDALYKEKMEQEQHREVLIKALAEIFGRKMDIKTEFNSGNKDEEQSLFD